MPVPAEIASAAFGITRRVCAMGDLAGWQHKVQLGGLFMRKCGLNRGLSYFSMRRAPARAEANDRLITSVICIDDYDL